MIGVNENDYVIDFRKIDMAEDATFLQGKDVMNYFPWEIGRIGGPRFAKSCWVSKTQQLYKRNNSSYIPAKASLRVFRR